MFIAVSTRDCRAACETALKELVAKRQEDQQTIGDNAYQAIHDGAVHNGLKPTLDDLQKMRDMANRDVEHMMDSHPANELIEQVGVYINMLDYNRDTDIALDATSFRLIGKYLGR